MGKKSKRRRDRREKVGAVVGSKAGPASDGNDAGGVPKRLKKIPEAARMFDKSSPGYRTLSWLLAPVTVETFFSKYWEKKPLLIDRSDNRAYYLHPPPADDTPEATAAALAAPKTNILSKADIEQYARDGLFDFPMDLTVSKYVDGSRVNYTPDEGISGPELATWLWKRFDEGCSIRMLSPHSFSETTFNLLRDVQTIFGSFVSSNSYLTPENSQGFAPHYDDIEAFIIQLEGAKHWRVYEPVEGRLPTYASRDFDQTEIGAPVIEHTLRPGDLLYMPRGFVHQGVVPPSSSSSSSSAKATASSSSSSPSSSSSGTDVPTVPHSLHLTLSAGYRNSWTFYLQELLKTALASAASKNEALRRSVPCDMRKYMGIVNVPQDAEEQEENEDGDDGDDDKSSDANRLAVLGRRASFHRRVHRMLEAVMAEANECMDEAADQLIRKNVRGQLPPVFAVEVDPEDAPAALQAPVGDGNGASDSGAVVSGTIGGDNPDAVAQEEFVPHTALDFAEISKREYRLVAPDICHMCVVDAMAVVYHSAQNSTYYLAEEEGAVTFDLALAPAMEFLIKSCPSWSTLAQLPVGGEGEDSDGDDEDGGDSALSMSLCAMLNELTRIGVLESRKIE